MTAPYHLDIVGVASICLKTKSLSTNPRGQIGGHDPGTQTASVSLRIVFTIKINIFSLADRSGEPMALVPLPCCTGTSSNHSNDRLQITHSTSSQNTTGTATNTTTPTIPNSTQTPSTARHGQIQHDAHNHNTRISSVAPSTRDSQDTPFSSQMSITTRITRPGADSIHHEPFSCIPRDESVMWIYKCYAMGTVRCALFHAFRLPGVRRCYLPLTSINWSEICGISLPWRRLSSSSTTGSFDH